MNFKNFNSTCIISGIRHYNMTFPKRFGEHHPILMTPSDIQFDPFWCWLNSCTCEEWSFLQSLASRWCSCGTGKGRQWRASSHQIYPLLPTSQPQHRRIRRVCAEFWLVTQSPIHHGRHLQKIQFHALKSVMFVQYTYTQCDSSNYCW